MSEHKAVISWRRTSPDFLNGEYSREHTWHFDGGITVPASPSPSAVPAPWSNPDNVDPEEAFVAAVSSCHMLTYLYYAYRSGFQVDSYDDQAARVMTKNDQGILWMSKITLRPRINYSGHKLSTWADEEQLHHTAHKQSFIANSVKTEIIVAA